MITLITGGVKSGKSAYALELMNQILDKPLIKGAFIATADFNDQSMKNKIEAHQKEREGSALITIEEKINLPEVIESISPLYQLIIVDCLTLWMSNLLYFMDDKAMRDEKINLFGEALKKLTIPCIIITNEVGMGIIPENKLARKYQDELGKLNGKIAHIAKSVILMVSGISVKIK
ncbi:MAG: bifunctional adenosylcobinamide kinase/adenosylcobinamide-phosphate guanylyltransferase [Spirochaetia bacterium]|nr:bifunctional adenosylcobinamide kinase/adenosylcobinamide-phosphate guanylyltransferase [Spirochaetia bacterium]